MLDELCHEKTCLMPHTNNKDADKPAHVIPFGLEVLVHLETFDGSLVPHVVPS